MILEAFSQKEPKKLPKTLMIITVSATLGLGLLRGEVVHTGRRRRGRGGGAAREECRLSLGAASL